MSGFIEWLEELNRSDTRVRAVLRRSLAFEPGTFPPAFPYVERFVSADDDPWRRAVHYLVAGLWAAHWRDARRGAPLTIGKASALHQVATGSGSTERRFINLLDADQDQLFYRLRQMVALLKEYPLDFDALLQGLVRWNDPRKFTQNAWARDFYRATAKDENQPADLEEEIQ